MTRAEAITAVRDFKARAKVAVDILRHGERNLDGRAASAGDILRLTMQLGEFAEAVLVLVDEDTRTA